ncbi:hypothetical protein DRP43_01360 [candidate division TA06 bacterium]|uniref:Uncharacterized protein n=1 Tax=candidate division TA06 bacterium TaxID=2250710 RepID=A0A660SN10_UNCT6|nr:MAG: hypothetical protein DRP43_01360 [candidate division TA06 bacterium]
MRRFSNTSLTIFVQTADIKSYFNLFKYFKTVNIARLNQNGLYDCKSCIDGIIDVIKGNSNEKYNFYIVTPIAKIPLDFIDYMFRWVSIYDGVFMVDKENNVIYSFGFISGKIFSKIDSNVSIWENTFIKYILSYEYEKYNINTNNMKLFGQCI